MERFYLKSFGCKVNQYDGQHLRERLLQRDLQETLAPEEADLVVLRFCVVTARSASRCLRTLKALKKRNPRARLLVAGCLSDADRERIRIACPEAEFPVDDAPFGGVSGLEGHTRAFVKVQDGCNLRCAYCIIPSIRGGERSRPVDEVSAEAGRLLEAGYRELVLCGIRLGGYRHGEQDLAALTRLLLREHNGEFRLRLSSLNPAEVTPGLLEVMAGDRRVARHLHLPLQSGDPRILKKMGRPYTSDRYLNKVEEVHCALEQPAISTDLMVGFPGEDEEAFHKSLEVLREVRVSRVHVFPYSPRPGTDAAGMDPVPQAIKTERVREALAATRDLKTAFDRSCLGRKERILVEVPVEEATGLPAGLTSRYQRTAILEETSGPMKGSRPINGSHPTGSLRPKTNTFVTVRLETYHEGLFLGRPLAAR